MRFQVCLEFVSGIECRDDEALDAEGNDEEVSRWEQEQIRKGISIPQVSIQHISSLAEKPCSLFRGTVLNRTVTTSIGSNKSARRCQHVLSSYLRCPAVRRQLRHAVRIRSDGTGRYKICKIRNYGALPSPEQQPRSHYYRSGKETPHGQVGSKRSLVPSTDLTVPKKSVQISSLGWFFCWSHHLLHLLLR